MSIYKGLELISHDKLFEGRSQMPSDQENQISVALGQLALVSIHMSKCLGISMKHPMIYNTHRSMIVHVTQKSTDSLPLYLSTARDYKTMDEALRLTEQNLRHIQRALSRLRDNQILGGVEQSREQELAFPNIFLLILYRIAEF